MEKKTTLEKCYIFPAGQDIRSINAVLWSISALSVFYSLLNSDDGLAVFAVISVFMAYSIDNYSRSFHVCIDRNGISWKGIVSWKLLWQEIEGFSQGNGNLIFDRSNPKKKFSFLDPSACVLRGDSIENFSLLREMITKNLEGKTLPSISATENDKDEWVVDTYPGKKFSAKVFLSSCAMFLIAFFLLNGLKNYLGAYFNEGVKGWADVNLLGIGIVLILYFLMFLVFAACVNFINKRKSYYIDVGVNEAPSNVVKELKTKKSSPKVKNVSFDLKGCFLPFIICWIVVLVIIEYTPKISNPLMFLLMIAATIYPLKKGYDSAQSKNDS